MRLEDLGEFPLIARLTAGLESRADVALGVGDDAAALDLGLGAGQLLLATCDAQVEGIHFLPSVATPEEIGHGALAVNLSDIAAMGGEPLWALVSLLAPPTLDVAMLDGIYAGMRALARQFNVALVGGNVSSTPGPLTLDITALGRVARERMLTRAGARPGDRLLVTGRLGAAVTALLAYTTTDHAALSAEAAAALGEARRAMVTPQPRVREGQALAATGQVTAMLDISDGLAGDLGHLCQRSGVGAVVELAALPVDAATRTLAQALGRDPLRIALTSGEDYELLFAARPDGVAQALEAVRAVGGVATVIGEITEAASGLRVREQTGKLLALKAQGWDHLRPHTQLPDAGAADASR